MLTREQSAASAAHQAQLDEQGFGFWAVEVHSTGEFIGFTGLDQADEGMPFTGMEIGWRLARSAWGHGYATEAALASLAFGFETLALPEIVAVTTATNLRSQAVMRRIGMSCDPAEDFEDPTEPEGPLRRNVLYRIRPSGQSQLVAADLVVVQASQILGRTRHISLAPARATRTNQASMMPPRNKITGCCCSK